MQKILTIAAVISAIFVVHVHGAAASAMRKVDTMAAAKAAGGVSIQATGDSVAAGIKLMVGVQDMLRQPTALVNKNTVATGNNVTITHSNIVFAQDDRLALVDTIEAMVRDRDASRDKGDSDASLTSAILAVVGASSSDDKMVAQVRAVLGCREHKEMLRQCIAAFVKTAPTKQSDDDDDEEEEVVVATPSEEIQDDEYYGKRTVVVNPPGPGVYGKKTVVGGRGRRYYPEDDASEDSDAAERLVAPVYRVGFRYPHRGGFRYGWRYPLSYWNVYGRRFYPVGCGFGRIIGPYYYC